MRFHFYSPVFIEEWDFRSPDTIGIGGSETCLVELSRRLARRGHEVTVYAPIRDDCPEYDEAVRWLPLDAADFTAPGIWVLSRCPGAIDHFETAHPDQWLWLLCQDVFYPTGVLVTGEHLPNGLTDERAAKLDVCLPLCTAHEKYLLQCTPELKGKTIISSNGLRVDLIEEIEHDELRRMPQGQREPNGVPLDAFQTDTDAVRGLLPPKPESVHRTQAICSRAVSRDPYKLVYTSSPDRGLATLLRIFKRARELEPRLTLTAAYGWDNIEKMMVKDPDNKYWPRIRKEIEGLMDQPGVTWRGRLPQPEEYREVLSAGIWCYPTTFSETSCCACMIAQGCGAVPITNPLWALADNVRHGIFIEGDPGNDPLCRAQYVGEIMRLTRNTEPQEAIRRESMPYARKRFDWSRVVDQYEELAKCSGLTSDVGVARSRRELVLSG